MRKKISPLCDAVIPVKSNFTYNWLESIQEEILKGRGNVGNDRKGKRKSNSIPTGQKHKS